MKNIKNLFLGLFIISLSSCLKADDMNIDAVKYKTNVIEFANTGDIFSAAGTLVPGYYSDLGKLKVGESKSFNVNVHYTGPGNAPADITVSLVIDNAVLTLYNKDNGVTKSIPPAECFSFPDKVVIKQGTNLTTVQAVVKVTANFDYNKAYALPLKIASVSSGIISGNFGTSLYAFGVRNEYDGIYSYKGYALRGGDPVLTGWFKDKTMGLVTTGSNSVQFDNYALWGGGTGGIGIGFPIMTINTSTGAVTLSSSGGLINAPGYNTRYEAASKTFFISGTWGGGPSSRLLTDTLTYMRPR